MIFGLFIFTMAKIKIKTLSLKKYVFFIYSVLKNIDFEYRNYSKFGIIDKFSEPKLTSFFANFPSLHDHSNFFVAPFTLMYFKGTAHMLPADLNNFSPAEFRKNLRKFVDRVPWDYVKQYLDASPLHFKSTGKPFKINFLLFRHDFETPLIYLKKAVGYNDLFKFGEINPLDRKKLERYLQVRPDINIITSFMQIQKDYSIKPSFIPLRVYKMSFTNILNQAIRHSLPGIFLFQTIKKKFRRQILRIYVGSNWNFAIRNQFVR